MLKEQRPFKFFKVPVSYMKEFAREAKEHGLLYVPIRNRQKSERIEVVVFADDASKIQRIYDNLGLDYVAAQAGDAIVEKAPVQEKQPPAAAAPSRMETVQTEHGAISIAANLTGSYMLRPIINDYILPGDFQGLVRFLPAFLSL